MNNIDKTIRDSILSKYKESKIPAKFKPYKDIRFLLENDLEFGYDNIIEVIFKKDPNFDYVKQIDPNTYYIVNKIEKYQRFQNVLVYLDKNKFLIMSPYANTYLYSGDDKELFEVFSGKLYFHLKNEDGSEKIKNENSCYYDSNDKSLNVYYGTNSLNNNIYYKKTTNTLSLISHDKISYIKINNDKNTAILKNSPYSYVNFDKETNEINSFLLNDKLKSKLLGMRSVNETIVDEVIEKLYNKNGLTIKGVFDCLSEYNEFFNLLGDISLDLNAKDLSINFENIKEEVKKSEEIFNKVYAINKKGMNFEDFQIKLGKLSLVEREGQAKIELGYKEILVDKMQGDIFYQEILNNCLSIKNAIVANLEKQKENKNIVKPRKPQQ